MTQAVENNDMYIFGRSKSVLEELCVLQMNNMNFHLFFPI